MAHRAWRRWYRRPCRLGSTLVAQEVARQGSISGLVSNPTINVNVNVELENLGREPTSLAQELQLTCFTARWEPLAATFQIQRGNRTLQLVTPTQLTLTATLPARYVFSHFRVFRFRPTRGRRVAP